MTTSPRLDLPFLMPQQAQKHLTINDSFRRLDVLVQTAVRSATVVEEPGEVAEGDLFILPAERSGGRWSAMEAGTLALFENGGFVEIRPVPGQIAFVMDEARFLAFDGASWTAEPWRPSSLAVLGINADPSAGNRLTVAADAELLTHDARTPGRGSARKVINKAGPANTAAVLFQTGFEGRAEIGLLGTDDLTVQVSVDGESFRPALRAQGSSGHVAVATHLSPVCALDVAGPVRVAAFAKSALPAADAGAGQILLVSDEAGGPVLAFSDGTLWRRVTDRAIVS